MEGVFSGLRTKWRGLLHPVTYKVRGVVAGGDRSARASRATPSPASAVQSAKGVDRSKPSEGESQPRPRNPAIRGQRPTDEPTRPAVDRYAPRASINNERNQVQPNPITDVGVPS